MRRRREDSRGVALIEAALVLPFLALLAFGLIESGFAWRDSNTLARATDQAARSDSRLADDPTADYEAIRALQSGLANLSASSIERVIIFDASGGIEGPPQQCLDEVRPNNLDPAGVPNTCNIYSEMQVNTDDPSAFGCGGGVDDDFCPTARDRSTPTPDRLGVWVELSYDKVVSVLPGSLTMTRTAIYQLEPCIAGAATC